MEQYPIGCLLKMITDKIKIQADANLAQHDLTLTQSRVLGYLAAARRRKRRSRASCRCRTRP